ncbi:hypothetical protein QJS04_geneDACA023816 [Acorus gramineus]|uniref:Uncharacterized protein n=1 Tax=Acorus gramineus TaxID=55184 RepID=A0AAV9AJZ7_ACOGR|nr:hypothetical protein QJS04_geneDACA023816 [Acorus gramineus]
MAGKGKQKDGGTTVLISTNGFAALDTLRKKKRSDKTKGSSGGESIKAKEPEPQTFWAPAPLNSTKWADIDDDDDDYYATTAPPPSIWGKSEVEEAGKDEHDVVEEFDQDIGQEIVSESVCWIWLNEDVGCMLVEGENDEIEPEVKKNSALPSAPKDTERQLSKKELKKKEIEEFEATLAQFKVEDEMNTGQDDSHVESKTEANVENEKKENPPAAVESSKSSKKKKTKKDKSAKEPKDSNQPNGTGDNIPEESAVGEPAEEDVSGIDVRERLKKVASTKKKKSNKEDDSAARAAAKEAAARSARLAAAKKKEKNHYNQQPMR